MNVIRKFILFATVKDNGIEWVTFRANRVRPESDGKVLMDAFVSKAAKRMSFSPHRFSFQGTRGTEN